MKVLACNTPYGQGGVGRHFAQCVEEARAAGALRHYYAKEPKVDDPRGQQLTSRLALWIQRYTPVRWRPSWGSYVGNDLFDRKVAQQLSNPVEQFTGFVGQSLRSFQRAREVGFDQLELVAVNSHVDNLERLHAQAARATGIRDTWLSEAERHKTLREYEFADTIHVHSEYVRQSFLAEGISADKLKRMVLQVDPRFEPPAVRPDDGVFRVVYVGRVEATKGVPLLLEAFAQLSVEKAELRIMGGWSTRAMRRYIEQWMDRDPRITVEPGDPLSVLQQADVFVHPTFEDGFGYAPMEALACGVPVIVTEDTGMKEYVCEGENGYVVPTGEVDALVDRIEHVRHYPLATTCGFHPSESVTA